MEKMFDNFSFLHDQSFLENFFETMLEHLLLKSFIIKKI